MQQTLLSYTRYTPTQDRWRGTCETGQRVNETSQCYKELHNIIPILKWRRISKLKYKKNFKNPIIIPHVKDQRFEYRLLNFFLKKQ